MNIKIAGLEKERFSYPLSHIAGLFFEEVNVFFDDTTDADATFAVDQLKKEAEVTLIKGELTVTGDARSYSGEFILKELSDENEKAAAKRLKHAVNYVFQTVLIQWTGIEQPWGTLTGVRPTKLLHQKLLAGETKAEAHASLMNDFLIHEDKVELLQRIVDRQLAVMPDLHHLKNEVSIYIGIPFCPTKCAYCTFPAYAIQGKQGSVHSFLGGLHFEMKEIGKWLKENNITITTIYYGGGTPTSISAEEMDLLYEEMYRSFPNVKNVREITVEAGRPDTITEEKLAVLKKWNIDRISINPQSYIQETLKAIGRHHTVEETVDKFKLARRNGMNNINMDLIIGLPGEGLNEFQHTLNETEKLLPESLTVHTLSFKRASEMTQNKRKYKVASREEITEMMNMAGNWTATHGYDPYYLYRQKNILGNLENVGYALPGQESLYNIVIMEEAQTIIGLGCGASSKFVHPKTGKIDRYANPKDPKSYNESYEKHTQEKIMMLTKMFPKTDQQ